MREGSTDIVVQKVGEIKRVMKNPAFSEPVDIALKNAPFDREQLAVYTLSALRKNPKIAECDIASIRECIMSCAATGLSPDPITGQAYIIPRWDKKIGAKAATFLIGYRGLIELAMRSGFLRAISAHVVYDKDEFEIMLGTEERIIHKPYLGSADRGQPLGAYAVATLAEGVKQFTWLHEHEIQKAKETNPMQFSGPWDKWVDRMREKTAMRRLLMLARMTPIIADALAREEGRTVEDIEVEAETIKARDVNEIYDDAPTLNEVAE